MPGPMDLRGDRPQPGPEQTGAIPVRRISRRTLFKRAGLALSLLAATGKPLIDAVTGQGSIAAAQSIEAAEPDQGEDSRGEKKLEAYSLASPVREKPTATNLEIRPLPGAERLRLSQLTKAQSYLQGTIDAMYASGNSVLIEYANTLGIRMQKGVEKFSDIDGVDQEKVQPRLYFSPSARETIYKVPFGPYIDDIKDSTGQIVVVAAVEMLETPMGTYPPNSENSIFGLVYSLDYAGAQASRLTRDLGSKNAGEVMSEIRAPLANVNEITYAVNQQMLAYDQSRQDLAGIKSQPSPQLEDLYSEWQAINNISNPNEKETALRELVLRRFFQ